MKVGDKVKISPDLTGASEWKEAVIIEVENNRFNGIVISAKCDDGTIFFGQQRFFTAVN